MKLNLNNPQVKQLIALPNNTEVYTSQRWRDSKKSKFLYNLRKLGYFKQLGRFRFIRTS